MVYFNFNNDAVMLADNNKSEKKNRLQRLLTKNCLQKFAKKGD